MVHKQPRCFCWGIVIFCGLLLVLISLTISDSFSAVRTINNLRIMVDHHANIDSQSNVPSDNYEINVGFVFTNGDSNRNLEINLRKSLESICFYASKQIHFNFIIDSYGHRVINDKFLSSLHSCASKVSFHNATKISTEIVQRLKDIFVYFRFKPDSYYGSSLFFLSVVAYEIFPFLDRFVLLDIDLKFNADIALLYAMFDSFAPDNFVGIAHEQQPVYRHILSSYRQKHPDTLLGDPPPTGNPGFNSGVLLLDLRKMREKSIKLQTLLTVQHITELTMTYQFQGHLGDQDLYTLLSFEHPELFYILPCRWNRQLCQWWKNAGYKDVFDLYNRCEAPIFVQHGNCRTHIP